MNQVPTRLYVLIFAVIFVAIWGIRVTKDSERLVVFRLGRLHRVAGPGISLLIPFVDRCLRVNLDEGVPGWQALDQRELLRRIEEFIRRPPAAT
jgi:regulator of protease activity HflC (stomatin/prohibitin superfamily)